MAPLPVTEAASPGYGRRVMGRPLGERAGVRTTADAFGREDGFPGGSQTLPQGAKALDHRDSRELKWPRDWGNHGARAAIEVWVFGGGTAAEKNQLYWWGASLPTT